MEKINIFSSNKVEVIKKIAIFSILIGFAVGVPAIIHQQKITGPIVNATLFLSVIFLSPEIAIFVGLLPSLIALSSGLLPAPLAPMVPFIMISNSILILVFSFFRKRNYWLGVVVSSCVKFLFLFATSSLVINLLFKKELASKVFTMMSWPQLITALAGGLIAFIFSKPFQKKEI